LQISSFQNRQIKNVVKLRQRRYRDSQCLTAVEGIREIRLALQNKIIPREAYVCPPLVDAEADDILTVLRQLDKNGSTRLFEVTPELFSKIAYRGESGGLLLVIPYFRFELEDFPLGRPPFLAVIEDVEKPGNLGAILRTSSAAGVDGVIVTTHQIGGGTDFHNPNVIRASLGAIFSVPVATASSDEAIQWLRRKGIGIVATTPGANKAYTAVDMTRGVALVMGSEAYGLSEGWLTAADEQVSIPMKGAVDSLNLAVSTALILYEVVRQRDEV